ncbi:MAG: methyltransferase domain-containing protein [Prosthecobacter sp.]|nr:methyltransferase domain-containing protein [Prosthecobacter sp.]
MTALAPPPRLSSPTGGLPSAVRWAHLLMEDRLRPGDAVVDGTAGNGHDTLFLARWVGPEGRVWAFDVQEAAVRETRRRLAEQGITHAEVIHAGHEEMAAHVPAVWHGRLAGIMFNLGYLPGSDKKVTTQVQTTLRALDAALTLLAKGGLMTIAVYPGHEDGAREQAAVEAWAAGLCPRAFEVQRICPINRSASPPECWAVWKRCA